MNDREQNSDVNHKDDLHHLDIQRQLDLGSHDVIYALRTAHQHQSQLLALADQKANILVGILSVVLTIIFTKVDIMVTVNNGFTIPAVFFILLEGAALLLALFVIMPKTIGRINSMDIEDIPNPFFFGFYTNFKEQEYLAYMADKLTDDESARNFLAKDLFQIGIVLKKKYKLLKYTYLLAACGVILLVISLIIYLLIA
jgi:hypothetical protein